MLSFKGRPQRFICYWISVLCLVSCTADDTLNTGIHKKRTMYLYAASSLDHIVTDLNDLYNQSYPRTRVISSLIGSQTARLQLSRGAPSGIFISADYVHITQLDERNKIDRHQPLAINYISLITTQNSPVTSLKTLIEGNGFAIGAEQVPVGHYAWRLLRQYQEYTTTPFLSVLRTRLKTQEVSARALRARWQRREVESAFLYQSDQSALKGFREVSLPPALVDSNKVTLHISITRSKRGDRPKEATVAWYNLALSVEGQKILKRGGLELLKHEGDRSSSL